jgi:hypothetical protein
MKSNMAQKYLHYFGNESSESLLEAYGIVTKDSIPMNTLNPRTCPNCNEGNTQDARFCSKCKMIMSFQGYQEALESQKQKESEVQKWHEKYEQDMKSMREEMQTRFEQILQKIDMGKMVTLQSQ